jgi:hypothetical protein
MKPPFAVLIIVLPRDAASLKMLTVDDMKAMFA